MKRFSKLLFPSSSNNHDQKDGKRNHNNSNQRYAVTRDDTKQSPTKMKARVMSTQANMFILSHEERSKEMEKFLLHRRKSPNLDLSYRNLCDFSQDVEDSIRENGGPDHYKSINLAGNRIIEISSNFGNFRNLIKLDLSNNCIKILPKQLWKLETLQILNLASNQITSSALDDFLVSSDHNSRSTDCKRWMSLSTLNLSFNDLDCIPVSLTLTLANMTHLYVSGNHITSIPETMPSMTELRVLALNHNQIKTFEPLRQMGRLAVVLIDGNATTASIEFGQHVRNLPYRHLSLISTTFPFQPKSMTPEKEFLKLNEILAVKKSARLTRTNSAVNVSPIKPKSYLNLYEIMEFIGENDDDDNDDEEDDDDDNDNDNDDNDDNEGEDEDDDNRKFDNNEDDFHKFVDNDDNHKVNFVETYPSPLKLIHRQDQSTPILELMSVTPPQAMALCHYCRNPIVTDSKSKFDVDDSDDNQIIDLLISCYEAESPTENDVIYEAADPQPLAFHEPCHSLWNRAKKLTF